MLFPDGVLIVDKPVGPTSHDIVAVVRRAAGRPAPKVGHTGTLDPLASGVLAMVLGRATRLAQFLSSAEKAYEADVELGISTTTFDRGGEVVDRSASSGVSTLTVRNIEDAIAEFRGTYLQQPPVYSAKKIDGDRAYDLARQNERVALRPAEVTVRTLEMIEWSGATLRLRLVCSAGFYVRALAHALGERLGTGGHLARLVRTRSGDFRLDTAVSLAELDRRPETIADRVIPLRQLLPSLPALTLTPEGALLAARGGFIFAGHLSDPRGLPASGKVRLLRPDGQLLAIAEQRSSHGSPFLHPGVVLE